jgi:hypothetical protein
MWLLDYPFGILVDMIWPMFVSWWTLTLCFSLFLSDWRKIRLKRRFHCRRHDAFNSPTVWHLHWYMTLCIFEKKNRQHNGQKKKYKRTNNDLKTYI